MTFDAIQLPLGPSDILYPSTRASRSSQWCRRSFENYYVRKLFLMLPIAEEDEDYVSSVEDQTDIPLQIESKEPVDVKQISSFHDPTDEELERQWVEADIRAAESSQAVNYESSPPVSVISSELFSEHVTRKLLNSAVTDFPDNEQSFSCLVYFACKNKVRSSRFRRILDCNVGCNLGEELDNRALVTVWKKLTGEQRTVQRVSHDWERIGFQGTDPITDINRCQGLLNLLLLLIFATKQPDLANDLYLQSHVSNRDFPLACVSVGLGVIAIEAFKRNLFDGKMVKTLTDYKHFRSVPEKSTDDVDIQFAIHSISALHISLLSEFQHQWRSRQLSIIHYPQLLEDLKKQCQTLKGVSSLINAKFRTQSLKPSSLGQLDAHLVPAA